MSGRVPRRRPRVIPPARARRPTVRRRDVPAGRCQTTVAEGVAAPRARRAADLRCSVSAPAGRSLLRPSRPFAILRPRSGRRPGAAACRRRCALTLPLPLAILTCFHTEGCKRASVGHSRLPRVQATELPHEQEQEERPGPYRAEEVLPLVWSPYRSQGNEIGHSVRVFKAGTNGLLRCALQCSLGL